MDVNRVQKDIIGKGFTSFVDEAKQVEDASRVDKIWYLSYGSNLSLDRFMCYVAGGVPVGSSRLYYGCRDKSKPLKSEGVVFKGSMFYAGESQQWGGGGFSFVDFNVDSLVLGRMYLITCEQFEDLVAQECGGEAGDVSIDFDQLIRDGRIVDDGLYGHMVHVCDYEGMPVVSFTTSFTLGDIVTGESYLKLNKPSEAYCNVVRNGVMEAFGISVDDADEYVVNRIGF